MSGDVQTVDPHNIGLQETCTEGHVTSMEPPLHAHELPHVTGQVYSQEACPQVLIGHADTGTVAQAYWSFVSQVPGWMFPLYPSTVPSSSFT